MRIFGKGFNFSQDGPGNRLVYHLSGCNMHCPWCSNADGMSFDAGKEYGIKEILDECISCKPMFFSGGGVTFTGGEATMQHGELLLLLRGLKNENIHTALETNGTSSHLTELLEFTDYLMMDFKHYDEAALIKFTGVGIENIKKNFEYCCDTGRQQHIRIPLINGINTSDPKGFAEYFSLFDTSNTVFEFLPYHEYGKEKWKGDYRIENGFVADDVLMLFKNTFEKYGLKTITT
jgi:pyruvate formate lyase activating enzyme